jgi:hypothetical protein
MKKTLLKLSIFALFFTYSQSVYTVEVRGLNSIKLLHEENGLHILLKVFGDTVPTNQVESTIRHQMNMLQGKWVHVQDSKAFVSINADKWSFEYEDEDGELDEHKIKLVDTIYLHNQKMDGKFLLLTQENDTLKYEIDYLTDKKMSLFYLPIGRFHDYEKVE